MRGRFPARRLTALLGVLALGVLLVAAQSGSARSEPGTGANASVSDQWVSVRLAGGDPAAETPEGRGYRQLAVPAGEDPTAYRAWLERQPGVLDASIDALVHAAVTPNDIFYLGHQALYLGPLAADAGWDITTDANEIVVAVLDTGIDLTHEDLVGNLWQNPDDDDNDGIDDDNNGCVDDRYGCRFVTLTPRSVLQCGYSLASNQPSGDVQDDHGTINDPDDPGDDYIGSHGTAVSGIVGARGDNRRGIAGVAWQVRLMTLKVLDCGPDGTTPNGFMSDVAKAIDYARLMGADIIHISFASEPGDTAADIPVLREAIERALADGLIIVAAAGNRAGLGLGFPAAYAQYPNVIGVGASDPARGNAWATYSSYGGGVDVAAPGSGIVSTIRSDLGSYGYGILPVGTSWAAPIVTGTFALVMARNPDLTMEEYIAIVQDSATPAARAPHGGNWAGAGLVNVRAALDRVPMTLSGTALMDWQPAPPGTPVRAFVDDVACGATVSEAEDGLASYSLRIAADGEIAGCGAPGREVEIRIGERTAGRLAWGEQNESLLVEGFELNAIEPPPGATVTQELARGWNLVAYLGPDRSFPEAGRVFPRGWEAAARWDTSSGEGVMRLYFPDAPAFTRTLDGLSRFDAVWVYSEDGIVQAANPGPVGAREVPLAAGWNTFVYTGPASAVEDALAGVEGRYTQVRHYDNISGTWTSYIAGAPQQQDLAGLYPYRVYWIYMTAADVLEMP